MQPKTSLVNFEKEKWSLLTDRQKIPFWTSNRITKMKKKNNQDSHVMGYNKTAY